MLCSGVLLEGLSEEGDPGLSQVPRISISHESAFSSRYECEMRLYELLPMEGKDMFGYFLALRWLKCISIFFV